MGDKGLFDITGKTALITGGSRGLGRAFAETMMKYGADVAITGRNQAKLDETYQLLKKYGKKLILIKADSSIEADVIRMVNETVKQLGKIDILFNNAGIGMGAIPIHELPTEQWDKIYNINLRGVFLTLKYVLKEMVKQKSGSIINISSIAGLRAEVPEVGDATYGATKAAVMNLTQVAAMEYAQYNIRVNCIAPGMHKSEIGHDDSIKFTPEMMEKMKEQMKNMDFGNYMKDEIPMGRMAEAEELEGLAILLASNASSYITGQIFVQDGGQSARL